MNSFDAKVSTFSSEFTCADARAKGINYQVARKLSLPGNGCQWELRKLRFRKRPVSLSSAGSRLAQLQSAHVQFRCPSKTTFCQIGPLNKEGGTKVRLSCGTLDELIGI